VIEPCSAGTMRQIQARRDQVNPGHGIPSALLNGCPIRRMGNASLLRNRMCVELTHDFLVQLAHAGFWKRLDYHHPVGNAPGGQQAPVDKILKPGANPGFIHLASTFLDHQRQRLFAPFRIGDADHGCFRYCHRYGGAGLDAQSRQAAGQPVDAFAQLPIGLALEVAVDNPLIRELADRVVEQALNQQRIGVGGRGAFDDCFGHGASTPRKQQSGSDVDVFNCRRCSRGSRITDPARSVSGNRDI
jgi:hypothetical protein